MADSELHVVLGAGQIGTLVAERLLARGRRVRMVHRGRAGPPRAGMEWVSGDLSDPYFTARAMEGARVAYECAAPRYDRWMALLPGIARATLQGAQRTGARLIILDNLYMYGRAAGPMTEDTPMHPCSRKGTLRAQLTDDRLRASARGEVKLAIGRASDFFGPGVTSSSMFGDRFFSRVFQGKSAELMGRGDLLHSYSYAPDVAEGLVTLGEREEALGRIWHLPVGPPRSTNALIIRLADALGLTIRTSRLSTLVLRGAGLFSPLLREVAEMAYQWQVDFVLDDSRFRAAFGTGATETTVAVAATAAWARARHATALAA